MLKINENITIEDWELVESFVRSSGPGGQNVNKVSSAVELRFEALRSPNLPNQVKVRLKKFAGRRWTNEGAIIIQVEETRYQARNREIARKRLKELILKATIVQKKRIATKPTASSQRRRIKSKKQRGEIKVGRKTIRKETISTSNAAIRLSILPLLLHSSLSNRLLFQSIKSTHLCQFVFLGL